MHSLAATNVAIDTAFDAGEATVGVTPVKAPVAAAAGEVVGETTEGIPATAVVIVAAIGNHHLW